MSADLNPYSSPEPTGEESSEERLVVGIVKCILIGLNVGLAGVVLCYLLLFPILMAVREIGLFLLLIGIPIGTLLLRAVFEKYLERKTTCLRCAIAFGVQYLVIGSGLGLILKLFIVCGEISSTPMFVFFGSMIGTMVGSLGGAFQGWIQTRAKFVQTKE